MPRSPDMLDTSYHRRRVTERMDDPEYRAEYERTAREVAQVNEVMRALNDLREQGSMSKAELARVIGRNDAVVRRFFTAQSNPELRTIAAMAEALDADIRIVPRRKASSRRATADVAGGLTCRREGRRSPGTSSTTDRPTARRRRSTS